PVPGVHPVPRRESHPDRGLCLGPYLGRGLCRGPYLDRGVHRESHPVLRPEPWRPGRPSAA
ncbi:MAG TPA: hypothetical protein VIQ30_17665, partial [Pseudonocardia sp.]